MAPTIFRLRTLLILLFATLISATSTFRNPIRALSVVRNTTIHNANHRITALSHFDLSFILDDGVQVKLALEPNHDIFPASGTSVTYLGPNGNVVKSEEIDRLAHKVFKGNAWVRDESRGHEVNEWEQAGWARVTVRRDGVVPIFEGAFSLFHDNHHVQTSRHYETTRHVLDPRIEFKDDDYMVVWRDSDILLDHHLESRGDLAHQELLSCSSDALDFNNAPDHPVNADITRRSAERWGSASFPSLFGKRQTDSITGDNGAGVNLVSTIGQTSGCPTTRKVALVGVATDCTYTAAFNSSETARQNVINQINTASSLYESTFNISLGLQNLTISDASCPGTPSSTTPWNQPCSDGVTITDRLNLFSAWRGTLQDSNSHWTLLSTCNTGSAVGLAWLGQACQSGSITSNTTTTSSTSGIETVAGANIVVRTSTEWQVIAHETGHTFGAVHDCTSQTCASATTVSTSQCCPLSADTCDAAARYIMNPSTSTGITSFSPCTIGNICSAFGRNSVNTSCFSDNKGVETITGQQCGNGIVESGEDCDCGGPDSCGSNPCCDPSTCKFTSGSVCDDSNDECCSSSCQFAVNGTTCRASTGPCDPVELCTGVSAVCPADVTAPDGETCGNGLRCASGQCTSRDLQCETVMGSYTSSGNDTYACRDTGCTLSCASPEFGTGICYSLQQNFLDGTTCGGGGKCANGRCQGSTFAGEARSWIQSHRGLVIGLGAGLGGLLILALLGCGMSSCRRRRRQRRVGVVGAAAAPASVPQGWNGYGAPPQREMQQDLRAGRGAGQGAWQNAPSVPPPAYSPRGGGTAARYA